MGVLFENILLISASENVRNWIINQVDPADFGAVEGGLMNLPGGRSAFVFESRSKPNVDAIVELSEQYPEARFMFISQVVEKS